MKNLKLNWENMFMGLLFSFVLNLLAIITMVTFTDKKVRSYYLVSKIGGLSIMADIDYMEDKSLELDRSISYNEAIEMVDKLNKSLNK